MKPAPKSKTPRASAIHGGSMFSRSEEDIRRLRKMVKEAHRTEAEAKAFLKRAGVSDKSPEPTRIIIGKDGFYTAAR